jgi:AcrR family transcriptional regulator
MFRWEDTMKIADSCCEALTSRADRRRQKLVETARKLFIENGFHATGIAQIAQQSGIAVGQIYRDFSSKEEIVAALVREDCARFMDSAKLKAAIEAGDQAGVLAWLHHFVLPGETIEGDRMFAEIVAESSRNPRIASIFTALHDELRIHLLNALGLLAPGKSDSDESAQLADTIMTFSLGVIHHRLLRPNLNVSALTKALQAIIDDRIALLAHDEVAVGRSAIHVPQRRH